MFVASTVSIVNYLRSNLISDCSSIHSSFVVIPCVAAVAPIDNKNIQIVLKRQINTSIAFATILMITSYLIEIKSVGEYI